MKKLKNRKREKYIKKIRYVLDQRLEYTPTKWNASNSQRGLFGMAVYILTLIYGSLSIL